MAFKVFCCLALIFAAEEQQNNWHHRQKRKMILFETHIKKKWPIVIPYRFSDSLTDEVKNKIKAVLVEDFESNTCLRFTEEVQDTHQFILFRSSDGGGGECKAYIGREHDVRTTNFQGQPIYLEDHCLVWRGSLLFLIASTLGMYSEVRRPDRDMYVNIFVDNIHQDGLFNFEKKDEHGVNTYDIPYDYGSVLHPGPKDWLKPVLLSSNGSYTVLPKDTSFLRVLGQRSELSFYDLKAINLAYCAGFCDESANTSSTPQKELMCEKGGYVDPNSCHHCKCPDGYAGLRCSEIITGSAACTPSSGQLLAVKEKNCVSSPNHSLGMPYEIEQECAWKITAGRGGRLELWFEGEFSLPHLQTASGEACLHWLEIQQSGRSNHRGPRYCGHLHDKNNPTKDNPIITESEEILVIFKAPNASIDNKTEPPPSKRLGFKLCYKIADVKTPETETNAKRKQRRGPTMKDLSHRAIGILVGAIIAIAFLIAILGATLLILVCVRKKKIDRQPTPNIVILYNPETADQDASRMENETNENAHAVKAASRIGVYEQKKEAPGLKCGTPAD